MAFGRVLTDDSKCDLMAARSLDLKLGDSGKSVRLHDLMVNLPNSRRYHGHDDFGFDQYISSIHKTPYTHEPTARYIHNIKNFVDEETLASVLSMLPGILNDKAEAICQHYYEGHGQYGIACAINCMVNVSTMLTGILFDSCLNEIVLSSFTSIPSFEHAATYSIRVDAEDNHLYLREVSDIDRGQIGVGPSVKMTINDEIKDCYFDMMTSSRVEYIVLGVYDGPCKGYSHGTGILTPDDYLSYKHPDTPMSRTQVSHYRMYDPFDSIDIGHCTINLPVICYRLVRYGGSCRNVILQLPYASDVEYLIGVRPELEHLVCGLIYLINYGQSFDNSCFGKLVSSVNKWGSFSMESIISNGMYKKTKHTQKYHGYGNAWDKIYETMFS